MNLSEKVDPAAPESADIAIETAKSVSRAMAKKAQSLAENPWQTLRTFLQFRSLMFFVNRPNLISARRHEKYSRLAAKRDPARFVRLFQTISKVQTLASSVVAVQSQRAAEYCDYDPNLTPPETDIRLIAFYLPQFHTFPENDEWWGKGFTEWTNVGKAMPLFDGQYQPHCPIHVGYYDLRIPEVMVEQAKIARQYGIGGFAHHFYWFAGKTLMEAPLLKMLENPAVDIPFCLSWANENWTRRWDGQENEVLIAQDYSAEDARQMIRHLAKYFMDGRYIRINSRPVFMIYHANKIPDVQHMKDIWQDEANKIGVGPLYLIGAQKTLTDSYQDIGFDASVQFPPHGMDSTNLAPILDWYSPDSAAFVYDYADICSAGLAPQKINHKIFRSVTLGWDNTARRKTGATILVNFSIAAYRGWLSRLCQMLRQDPSIAPDEKIVFINAWNEWAEGTHLEPDQRFGFAYLDATRKALTGPYSNPGA